MLQTSQGPFLFQLCHAASKNKQQKVEIIALLPLTKKQTNKQKTPKGLTQFEPGIRTTEFIFHSNVRNLKQKRKIISLHYRQHTEHAEIFFYLRTE